MGGNFRFQIIPVKISVVDFHFPFVATKFNPGNFTKKHIFFYDKELPCLKLKMTFFQKAKKNKEAKTKTVKPIYTQGDLNLYLSDYQTCPKVNKYLNLI